MCLIVDRKKTEELKNSGQEFVDRYKIVIKFGKEIESRYFQYTWKVGCNEAGGSCDISKCWDDPRREEVQNGIHVYVNYDDVVSRNANVHPYKVMKVKCYVQDLIAVGNYYDLESEAYTKVYVDELPK